MGYSFQKGRHIKPMGWLFPMLGAIASYLFFSSGGYVLMGTSLACAAGALWSWGIMHNYAVEQAKRRSGYRGGFYDIEAREADAAPNWTTLLNLFFSLGCTGAFIAGLVMKLT